MNREEMLDRIGGFGLNLYDAAVMDDDGISLRRYQPCNYCNNSYSVAKAFTMTAVGLLYDDGLLSVEDAIPRFFPEWEARNQKWADVRVEHALLHRIGFAEDFLDVDEDAPSFLEKHRGGDYLSLVVQEPLGYPPGTHYAYSDTAYYLLSRIVSIAGGANIDELLRTRVLNPMGFGPVAWSRCPAGYPMGATGLYISAMDMVKLPWLYLNGGVYGGRRLISEEWVRQALELGYEFQPVHGTRLIGKGGINCQMTLFSPDRRFAVAWHAYSPNGSDRRLVQWLAEI